MKNRFGISVALIIISGSFIFHACTNYKYDNDPYLNPGNEIISNCVPGEVTYENTILDILQNNCIACHNSSSPAAGLDYSDYDRVIRSAADGSLQGSMEQMPGFSPMPPGNPLDSCTIKQINTWIAGLDLDSLAGKDSVPGSFVESTCDPDTVYFQNTILPLVVSSCATTHCHDQDSHREGIILTDYSSIMKTGRINPGNPGESKLYRSLLESGEDQMPPPPNDPLTDEQVRLIKTWILQDAKNNSCIEGCDTIQFTFSLTIWPLIVNNCTGCHSAGNPGGGIVMAGYPDLVPLVQNGQLLGAIRYDPGYAAMPPNKQWNECNIRLVEKWIEAGYPEN